MRITFLLPEIELSGGVKAVFEFANHLHKRGHQVFVVWPLIPMRSGAKLFNFRNLASRAKRTLQNLKKGSKVDWFELKANLIRVPTFAQRYIPEADVILATWWETAYYVSKYGKSKGEKFYLVQHYEVWGGPKDKVDNSYRLGLKIIVNSTWLKNILEKNLRVPVEALILHAPDRDAFYPEDNLKRNKSPLRILIPYRKAKWKGTKDGILAFEIARERFPDIQLVMFGPTAGKDIPPYAEFHLRPSHSQLREIYNSCDIFVFPSHSEGFGMPPLEAMACKCAVVTTNVGAVPDYAIAGKTALVSEPRDVKGLAQNIIRLIENEKLRKEIAENGYNYTKQFTWERATAELEKVFRKYVKER